MGGFPWTCDQYQRYAVLDEALKVLYKGQNVSVLDVGGVSPDREGRTLWLPLKKILTERFCVTDLQFCREQRFIQGDGLFLPFKADSFDVVSALDVIEHIPGEQREPFIKEMARVSRSGIVLSAPFKDEQLEQAERILFEQIRELYGAEHQQLLEHRRYGLPEISSIDLFLSQLFTSQTNFSYGSLQNWLFFQSLKNLFLFRKKADFIHSLIDRWMVSCDQESEFIPPYSKRFWLASKNISQAELDSGTAAIKDTLLKSSKEKPKIEELGRWAENISNIQAAANVSAVVFSFGITATTEDCFNHLLTQKTNFGLDVVLADLSPGQSAAKFVRERFPNVEIFIPKKRESLSSLCFRLTARLKGDYFLWVSDDILVPQDSAAKMRRFLREAPSILIPWIEWGEEDFVFWGTGRPSSDDRRRLRKIIEGALTRPPSESPVETADWIFSECLFFAREALTERNLSKQMLTRENVFLWSSIKPRGGFLRSPIILVHKKGGRKCPE